MTTTAKRMESIMRDLRPEEKAVLVIEDGFQEKPVLSPAERARLLKAMAPEEGRRYNAVIDRYYRARELLETQRILVSRAERDLLERDRILWYLYAVGAFLDRLAFGARPLLEDNPNLKPGKPLEIRLPLATVRLGVWGRKRHPFPPKDAPQVEVPEQILEALDGYARRIRETVADVKAILAHLLEEARAMGLESLEGFALGMVAAVRRHDGEGAIIPGLQGSVASLVGKAERVKREDGFYDLVSPWALAWEDVEESAETLRRARESTDGDLLPVSLERGVELSRHDFLEGMKALARREREGGDA